jgi:hypothetical protein
LALIRNDGNGWNATPEVLFPPDQPDMVRFAPALFAVDPDRVLAGEDGSYPGFFLPIQYSPAKAAAPTPEEAEDSRSRGLVKTSNHLAQWTARIVSDPKPDPPDPPNVPDPPIPEPK